MAKELEKEYRTYLPSKSYAVVRVDGKGFSKYTKGLEKPFDWKFTEDMRETAAYLCENIDGAILGYTQSDEISIVFSDLGGANTQWWFGGQVQKIVSITASMATAQFGALRGDGKLPLFDARVHHLDGLGGVLDYLQWRQADAIKNSVGMLASHYFSHKELMGVSTEKRVAKLSLEKDVDWSRLSGRFRQGSLVRQELQDRTTTFTRNGQNITIDFQRKEWEVRDAPRIEGIHVGRIVSGVGQD